MSLTKLCPVAWLALALTAGCGGRTHVRADEVVEDADVDVDEPPVEPQLRSDKLDLLFVIDNSETASFAHAALAETVPYLLDRLLNPRCVNGLGQIVDEPASPDAPCEVGLRDFAPLRDIHVGVITTSMGGHGADTCSPQGPDFHPDNDDRAHLISRLENGGSVPTYEGIGFLAWDPDQAMQPPGDSDPATFAAKLDAIVNGVNRRGCGFEAPLEAFYRFLIDPQPPGSIDLVAGNVQLSGTDSTILAQRGAFLRRDSAVMVVILSDEDDCSIRDGGQSYFAAQGAAPDGSPYHLPRPTSACATDPDDPCCRSCGQSVGNCPPDPVCDGTPLSASEDPLNLRCFDQKRRFGLDFMYPLQRYVDGLTLPQLPTYDGVMLPNPLFVESRRDPSMISVAAIVGVPWQDIALSSDNLGAGFVPAADIPWDLLLPDGPNSAPGDPLMLGSRSPRSGVQPITGEPLAPPSADSPTANGINGHEHLNGTDLQYSCIYRLPEPEDCTITGCECQDPSTLRPVCQADDGSYGFTQYFGRATPPTRMLTFLRELGPRAALGSHCPELDVSPAQPAYGFKPAADAVLRLLRRSLVPFEGQ